MKKTERILQVGKRWLEIKVRKSINALYLPERASLYRRLGPLLEAVNARLTLPRGEVFYLVTLQGIGRDSVGLRKVLYAAKEDHAWTETFQYVCSLLFGDTEPVVSERITCTAKQLRRQVEVLGAGCDLVCVEANRALLWRPRHGAWVISPQRVRMVIDFAPGETWEQVKKRLRSQRQNIRIFRHQNFSVRFSRSESDLERFYDGMYLPLVRRRYSETGYIETRKVVQDWMRRGELMFLVDPSGRDVAGSVNINQGRVKFMMINGVLDADPGLIRQGVLSGIYYESIRIGFEGGYQRCDFGDTRPFGDDGVYQHKTRWGMKSLADPWYANQWLFWAPEGAAAGRRWLRQRAFLREFVRTSGWSPDPDLPAEEGISARPEINPAEPGMKEKSGV